MKKTLITVFLFAAAVLLPLPFAIAGVNRGKEQLTITEECLSGDSAAADGITLEVASHLDRYMMWDTAYTIGSGSGAESKFTFSRRPVSQERSAEKSAYINHEFSSDFGTVASGDQTASGSYSGVAQKFVSYTDSLNAEICAFPKAVRAVADRTQAGETRTETVRLADYYEFWPLTFHLEGMSSIVYEGDYNTACDYLTDFFRIPTADALLQITLEKNPTDHIVFVQIRVIPNSAPISVVNQSAFGQNGLYFSFRPECGDGGDHAASGQDQALFYFPFTQEDNFLHIDLTQVQRLCRFPDGLSAEQLLLNEEENLLYLLGRSGTDYKLCLYSLAGETPVLLQQLPIERGASGAEQTAAPFCRITRENGGVLMIWNDGSFSFAAEENGRYRQWCSGVFPVNPENPQDSNKRFLQENVCAFDGTRLVLAAFESKYSLNVLLTVCREGEQVYSGLYRHSGTEPLGFSGSTLLPKGVNMDSFENGRSAASPLRIILGGEADMPVHASNLSCKLCRNRIE